MALARALVNEPRVLLLDEPLGALDLKLREEMQVELQTIQREVGITFVFVTHDQGEALSMSSRVAVFSHGQLEQVGTPREIYEHPATSFVASFVGSSNLLDDESSQRLLGVAGAHTVRPERIRLLEHSPECGRREMWLRRARSPTCSTSAPIRGSTSSWSAGTDWPSRLRAPRGATTTSAPWPRSRGRARAAFAVIDDDPVEPDGDTSDLATSTPTNTTNQHTNQGRNQQ